MKLTLKQIIAAYLFVAVTAIATLFWVCPGQITQMPRTASAEATAFCALSITQGSPTTGESGNPCTDYHTVLASAFRGVVSDASILLWVFLLAIITAGIFTFLLTQKNAWQFLRLLPFHRYRQFVRPPTFLIHKKLFAWFSHGVRGDFALGA